MTSTSRNFAAILLLLLQRWAECPGRRVAGRPTAPGRRAPARCR